MAPDEPRHECSGVADGSSRRPFVISAAASRAAVADGEGRTNFFTAAYVALEEAFSEYSGLVRADYPDDRATRLLRQPKW